MTVPPGEGKVMAGTGAIAATSKAVIGLLKAAAATHPSFATAEFKLVGAADLQTAPAEVLVASLYLHHVAVNSSRGSSISRVDAAGRALRPALPLELHYLLTAWSKSPETQQSLLGWCVRIVHDTPTLPAALLNRLTPGVFRPDETVELVWEPLTQQVLFDVWQVAQTNQQPSASYVARIVEIDSLAELTEAPLVQTREQRYLGVSP
jgi:hypothetical protein